MSRIGELLDGLEDPYPLFQRRVAGLKSLEVAQRELRQRTVALELIRFRGRPSDVPGPAMESPIPALDAELLEVSEAIRASEARWLRLERAVEDAEEAEGLDPPAPGPAVLEELGLWTHAASVLAESHGLELPPEKPPSVAGRTALAVGAGIALMALGAPHVAIHAAIGASKALKGEGGESVVRRPPPGASVRRALHRIRDGIPAGESSANAVREALDALSSDPQDDGRWSACVEAAQERVGVLRRAHLRSRAEALVARETA